MKKRSFVVRWEIEVDAPCAEGAALEAWAVLRDATRARHEGDPGDLARVLSVEDPWEDETVDVDMGMLDSPVPGSEGCFACGAPGPLRCNAVSINGIPGQAWLCDGCWDSGFRKLDEGAGAPEGESR